MKKVLYLSYDGMTDPLGQSQVIPYLEGLAEQGYQISLISFEKKDNYWEGKEQIQTLLEERGIRWYPLSYTKQPPVFSTLWDVCRMIRKAVQLHRKEQFFLVHCRSYITPIAGRWLKKKFGIKFIFDMRGFWVDERVEGGLWNLKNPLYYVLYNFFKKTEKNFLKEADVVISLTEKAKTVLEQKFGVPANKIYVIPCCVDLELFNPRRISEETSRRLCSALNIQTSDFIISYLGALGTVYMLDEMLLFFAELLKVKPESKFLFITPSPAHDIYAAAVRHKVPKNKIIAVKAKRGEVPAYLSLSHLAIFFYRPSFSRVACSPTKLGEILSLGIPVVCNAGVGDITSIILEAPAVGAVIQNFDVPEYRATIRKIPDLVRIKKTDIVAKAHNYFSLDMGCAVYKKIYDHLTTS